jgi:hypothetical protein
LWKIRNELKLKELKELKIGKWIRLVRITEMELRNNFGSMTEFVCWNP